MNELVNEIQLALLHLYKFINKTGTGGTGVPSGVQGQSPSEGLGQSSQKPKINV